MQSSQSSSLGRLRHAAGALLVLLAFAQIAPGPVLASDTQEELRQARDRLEDLRKEYRVIEARVKQIRAGIQSLTNQITQVTSHLEALALAVDEAEAGIRRSESRAEELQIRLDARARDVYIRGPAGVLELILEAKSLPDLADRFSFLDALSRGDASVAEGVEAQRQELAGLRKTLKEYEDVSQRLRDRLVGKDERLKAKWEAEEAAKAALEEKVDEAEEIVADLEEKLQQEYLERYGITGGGNVGPPPSADGPFYWCPVSPPRSYVDDFGAPRVGHTHQGNDIFAPAGTPIHAPFAGTAEEGYDGLGGIVVHVYAEANADYVYNAHLAEHVGVDGQHVNPGDVIGLVGNTGNAASTPPHDHFEYHPGGGSAVSPYVYLNEVCGVGGQGF
jgi:murein DD-endopeptidase MepM/ murein hydrolase activator NlpD